MEEINNQLRLAIEQNEKFWSDFLKNSEIFDKQASNQWQSKTQEKTNQFSSNN